VSMAQLDLILCGPKKAFRLVSRGGLDHFQENSVNCLDDVIRRCINCWGLLLSNLNNVTGTYDFSLRSEPPNSR
jgi:hypothetical protein